VSNLIKFKPRPDDNGEAVKIKQRSKCAHYSFEVDMESRTVTCDHCHDSLDPIFVLFRLTEIYADRDYKFHMIQEFEKKEAARREREYAKRLTKETKRQQRFAKDLK
jgi:hypothetical protein